MCLDLGKTNMMGVDKTKIKFVFKAVLKNTDFKDKNRNEPCWSSPVYSTKWKIGKTKKLKRPAAVDKTEKHNKTVSKRALHSFRDLTTCCYQYESPHFCRMLCIPKGIFAVDIDKKSLVSTQLTPIAVANHAAKIFTTHKALKMAKLTTEKLLTLFMPYLKDYLEDKVAFLDNVIKGK
jgi:hypothetical protein